MGLLDGKRALVTGGGSGLGRAVAERFAKEGARVAVADVNPTKIEAARQWLGDRGVAFQCDVTDMAQVDSTVAGVEREFGGIDVLVGCQGIWDGNLHLKDLPKTSLSTAFDEIFAVNVKGYLLSARAAMDLLVASKGSIIFTLSNAAFLPDGGGPLYTASKHAVLGLVRQLAFELAPRVRVNGVAPGAIGGSELRGAAALGQSDQSQADVPREVLESMLKEITPLQVFSHASDYGMLFTILASSEYSGPVTGHVIEADQGMSIRGFQQAAGGIDL